MRSNAGRQLHVFLFPFMAHGHMIPMIDIAKLFALRGVKSTIITTPLNASNISSKISRYQNSGLHINIKTVPFPSEEAGLPKGCENMDSVSSRDMMFTFIDAVPILLEPQLDQLLEEMRPDCVVADMFLPWTTDVARKHGIPRLVFHGTSIFSLCVVNSLKHYNPQKSESDTFLVPGLPDEIILKKSQLPNHLFSRDKFTEVMDRIRESEVTSYGVLVNSFYELEHGYFDHWKTLGRKAWHIGPVSLTNSNTTDKAQRGKKGSVDEESFLNWLSSKDPQSVLYVSFGSVSRFSCSQLTEIAEGLEASGVPFIWVVRTLKDEEEHKFLPDGFEERIKGKGLVIRDWAPQVLILDHPAIGGFMTHCGWNSILEGVSAGVPMITWPLFAEQFYNEVLIAQVLKVGIKVGVEKYSLSIMEPGSVSVTKERVEKVVRQLMRSEEGNVIRNRNKEFKEIAKEALEEGGSSYSDLTDLIEELHHPAAIGQ